MVVERCRLAGREHAKAYLYVEREKSVYWSHRRSTTYDCDDIHTRDGGRVVINWFQIEDRPEVCILDYITTRPAYARGRGYATEALMHEVGEIADSGCRYLGGEVLNSTDAVGFWGRLGVKQGRIRGETYLDLENLQPVKISLKEAM